jgi:hypothetical protein
LQSRTREIAASLAAWLIGLRLNGRTRYFAQEQIEPPEEMPFAVLAIGVYKC